MDQSWTRSVELELPKSGNVLMIKSTREASECLRHWPEPHGAAYREAKRVCREAMMGEAPIAAARAAFVSAAEEAGIFIRQG